MKKRHKRLALIIVAVAGLTVSVLFVMNAFRNNLVFFFSPSDVAAGKAPTNRPFRLGGVVVKGSVKHGKGLDIRFVVTDFKHSIPVHYDGILPDLFSEGRGVVTRGKLGADGVFYAEEVLAKHDEAYMPPEVAESLHTPQAGGGAS